jgi:hypothetical protein
VVWLKLVAEEIAEAKKASPIQQRTDRVHEQGTDFCSTNELGFRVPCRTSRLFACQRLWLRTISAPARSERLTSSAVGEHFCQVRFEHVDIRDGLSLPEA